MRTRILVTVLAVYSMVTVVTVTILSEGCGPVHQARSEALIASYNLHKDAAENLEGEQSLQQQMMIGVLVNDRCQTVIFTFEGGLMDFRQEVPANSSVKFALLPGKYIMTIWEKNWSSSEVVIKKAVFIDAVRNDVSWNGVRVDYVAYAN